KSIEYFVETYPIRMRRAEQRPQRRFERYRLLGGRRRQDGQGVAGFRKANVKAVVAQRPAEASEAPARRRTQRLAPFTVSRMPIGSLPSWDFLKVPRHHATLPRSSALTSRVTRARSSCVLSKQIIVS